MTAETPLVVMTHGTLAHKDMEVIQGRCQGAGAARHRFARSYVCRSGSIAARACMTAPRGMTIC